MNEWATLVYQDTLFSVTTLFGFRTALRDHTLVYVDGTPIRACDALTQALMAQFSNWLMSQAAAPELATGITEDIQSTDTEVNQSSTDQVGDPGSTTQS